MKEKDTKLKRKKSVSIGPAFAPRGHAIYLSLGGRY